MSLRTGSKRASPVRPSALLERTAVKVSVIVVTWNNAEVIHDCLRSIFEEGGNDIEAIVCDNASGDATVETVENGFPKATILQTGANLGFAPAVNLGIREARGERIMLLNPEASFFRGALRQLIDTLDANPSAGAVGPCIVESDGAVQPTAARRFPSPWLALAQQLGIRPLLEKIGRGETLAASLGDEIVSVPCLSGAAMMVSRSVLETVGSLDEALPMYLEDLDFCARIGRSGLDLLYVPKAVVVHDGGYSSNRSPHRDLLYAMAIGQAPWMYRRRFHGAWSAHAYAAAVGVGSLFRLILLAPLLCVGKISHRPSDRSVAVAHRARVLLNWAVGSKSRFLANARSAFASVGTQDTA